MARTAGPKLFYSLAVLPRSQFYSSASRIYTTRLHSTATTITPPSPTNAQIRHTSHPLTTHQPKNLRCISSTLVDLDHTAWPHPVYTQEQMDTIQIAHRTTKTWSDWVALTAVKILRWGFDMATGYKHDAAVALGRKDPGAATQKYAMTEEKWIVRFIFLESIAGVPGMVGGMVRHLHSLRCLRKDHGWIETLLEESQNERMHLLTFLKFRDPPAGWFMRMMILGAQGVFTNFFFLAYLMSPKTCHRFVGYLEEEAVITYTRAIADLEAGKLPKWEKMKAPQIAKDYFKLPDGKDGVRELLKVIRADEAKHREVNHTLANLQQEKDINPYAAKWDGAGPKPTKGLETVKQIGWEREEVAVPGLKVEN